MSRRLIPAALLLLCACSPDPTPPPGPPRPKLVTVIPNPEPETSKPAETMPAPPKAPPSPAPRPKPPAPPEPVVSRRPDPPSQYYLPSFTFRCMEPGAPKILLNGDVLGSAPCLWTISDTIEFDPDIRVQEWPPEDAKLAGTTELKEFQYFPCKAEIYVADSRTLAAKFPKLREGETVLFVKAVFAGRERLGALRLLVEGHHYIDYTPLINPEGDDASRFLRTIWFERN